MNHFIVTTVFVLLSCNAFAKERHQNREKHQEARIHQGLKSGELTKKEAKGLMKEQKRIDRMQERANSDGTITAEEKIRLENAQDKASRQIYKQKHDDQGEK